MRSATEDDRPAVHELLQARDAWARPRGLVLPDSISVRVLLDDADDDMALMVLEEDRQLVGCAVLHATTPGWGWTPSERAEPSTSLATMYTHPAHHDTGLGRLMVLWVLDYAARRTDTEQLWVRCCVQDTRLMQHFRDELGFDDVHHTRDGNMRRIYQMQQRPRELPGLRALITGDGPVLGDRSCRTTPRPLTPRCAGPEGT